MPPPRLPPSGSAPGPVTTEGNLWTQYSLIVPTLPHEPRATTAAPHSADTFHNRLLLIYQKTETGTGRISQCTEPGAQNRAVYSQCTEPGVQNRAVYSQRTEPGVQNRAVYSQCTEPGVHNRTVYSQCTEPGEQNRAVYSQCTEPGVQNRAVYSQCTEPGVQNRAVYSQCTKLVYRTGRCTVSVPSWCTEQGGVQSVHRAWCTEQDGVQ